MLSSRKFLVNSSIAAAAALLAPSLVFAADKKIVGLQLYSLRDELPLDVKGTLAKVAEAGYKEVELYGFSTKNQFWGLTPIELKKILDANGLKAVSGHYSLGTYFADDDMTELMASIEACKVLGSKFLTIPWLAPEVRATAEDYKKVAAKLNEIGSITRASGIKTSYHNHDFEFAKFGSETGYDILLKNTDKKYVDFELDLYWLVRSQNDPKAFFAANPGRFTMWHVKDMDKADPKLNAEVGTGSIDFKSIFAEAKISGMKNFFVEHETNYKPNPLASIAQSCTYVKAELI